MKRLTRFFIALFLCVSALVQAKVPDPVYAYLTDPPELKAGETVKGPARILDLKGRKGINIQSVWSTITLGKHNLNDPKGSVVMWFFALEDLAASIETGPMRMHNKDIGAYVFLSDYPQQKEYGKANFYLAWFRYNELRAQFFKGSIHPVTGFEPPQKTWVQAVPFNYFDKFKWYQVAFTWDVPAKDMRLYVNGILVGTSDRFNKDFYREQAGPTLYSGNTAICQGEVKLYDKVLSGEDIYDNYRATATDYDPAVEKELRHLFCGDDLKDFKFKPGKEWIKKMDLDLKDPSQIGNFYVQGEVGAVRPGARSDGLLIETPAVSFEKKNRVHQVYIWTNQIFEGNLYVEFEWMALKPNGLSLIMVNATGMHREPFMEDYPKRTTGLMDMVHKEDVRNYHWEFFREMNDVRNDIGTAFSRKNPFGFRNGFGSYDRPFEKNVWHKAQLLLVDGHMQCAVDGKIVMEWQDQSRTNTGAILNSGNIGIRCMLNTAMVYRNLKVYNEKLPFSEVALINPLN